MRRKKMVLILTAFTLAWTGLISSVQEGVVVAQTSSMEAIHPFGKQILKQGARGGDVYELQGRLKLLGFYTGKIDGVFGNRVYKAVRLFQYRFGLKIDGVVGPKTKLKLWKATKHWRPSSPPPKKASLILKPGSQGNDVLDLQGRLKFLGFYTGEIDGKYSHRVYLAVRLFQYRFGLKVDGTAGPDTLTKLRKATQNYNPYSKSAVKKPAPQNKTTIPKSSKGLSQNDITLLAQTIHAEARGEPYIGQVAVGAVILNRLQSENFPDTISGIVFQPLAFEAVADGQIWLQPSESAKKAARDALNGWDPSGGAVYYFNPDRATSKWIWSRPQIKRIGKHIFMK
ncbi:spore cortex-lytic enzyme [Hazenella coriacea]|uniref:Spore cortex-lytic enzyme n=1 Tax=Hazenella coriacea TaxID=1179467 RepID=A0A4R3LAF3_9BACL|nr:spore cortex-lytic enzyme [Hazenella coriacea]